MREEIGRYRCRGASGQEYTVVEYQRIIRSKLMDGTISEAKGTKSLILSDGRDVNFIDETTFQIVITDEIIRKVS